MLMINKCNARACTKKVKPNRLTYIDRGFESTQDKTCDAVLFNPST